jgi:hypothetical protein
VAKLLKALRQAAPVLTSLDVLLLSAAGVRVNVSICSSDEDLVFDSVFSDQDEDDELGSDRFIALPRYSEEEIATALEAKQEEILAAVHDLCMKDPFEMHAVLIPYLQDFPDVRPHDIPRQFTVALRQKAAEVHGRELAAMSDSLVPELFALVSAAQVATATVGELVATAREVQRRHHDCASSDTAKSLICQAKKAAKHVMAPLAVGSVGSATRLVYLSAGAPPWSRVRITLADRDEWSAPLPRGDGSDSCRGWQDVEMADLRRPSPEPAPGLPEIRRAPGMAKEMLRDMAPLLAEEGIDLDNVPDLETLNRAMARAVERRNLELFSPVGVTRDIAVATLRPVVAAVLDGDTVLAATLLDQVEPESPDNSVATVASCIGIALGLLDDWMSGQDTTAPTGLARQTRIPAGHWNGERAASDILVLAAKGRAFRSMDKVLVRQGGPQVLSGSALALAAAITAWAHLTDTPSATLIPTLIR